MPAYAGKNHKKSEMNAKQQEFCRQYMIDYNATQAYIRAGYAEKGANVAASGLLTKLDIKAEIARLQAEKTQATGITAQRVVAEIAKLAFATMKDFTDESNDIRKLHDVDADAVAAVTSFTTTTSETFDKFGQRTEKKQVKLGLANKAEALEKLAKHLGLYNLDNEQKAKVFKVSLSDE
jgi:phage terminase small subunit